MPDTLSGHAWDLVHAPLGVTVATAVQAVNQSVQARIGALLWGRQFPQIPAGFQGQTSGLHDHLYALFHQVAHGSVLFVVPAQAFCGLHSLTITMPDTLSGHAWTGTTNRSL